MATSTFGDSLWAFVVVGGFVILGAALLYARLRNRTTPEQDRRRDEATRTLYKDLSEEDRSRTP